MPITQDRMIAVIREAFKLKLYAEGLKDDVNNAILGFQGGPAETLIDLIQGAMIFRQLPSTENLMIEARHYQMNSKKNIKMKERARRKRRGEGKEEYNTGPTALVKNPLETEALDKILADYAAFNRGEWGDPTEGLEIAKPGQKDREKPEGPKASGGKDPKDEKDILSGMFGKP